MVLIKYYIIAFILLLNFKIFADSLNKEELIYFNFIDLNNDEKISTQEASQIINLIFQLLDKNNDENISKDELIELKNIIESLS
tara:strand:+ start:2333 stop:2584 length:252 start_codon:yes stop_codon:yes gene_type:complete